MAAPTAQYVRHHQILITRVNWGVAFSHLHNLNDGGSLPQGYTPNLVTIEKAWVVDAGNAYHAIDTGVARVASVTAVNVNIVVGDNGTGAALIAALTAVLGAAPLSIVLEVTTRFAHSVEIGTTAVGDETIGAALPANLGLPISLSAAGATTLQTIFVRTTGLDTNDGTTAGTAVLTIQEACNRIMRQSPLDHSVLVDIGVGVFAGTWTLDGIELKNGANVYIIGNAPGAAATDKISLSAGAATLTTTRDWMGGLLPLRWTGDVAWAGAGVPAASDIGRTVRIDDGAGGHIMYATVANVGTGGVLATRYVDLVANPGILLGPPAWLADGFGVVPAGVTLRILDHLAAAQVTAVTGSIYIGNVHSVAGSSLQPVIEESKHNLLGHIRFTATVIMENAERFAFHGTRFENGLTINDCRDCTSNASTVPVAGTFLYWPAAIWTRLGYSHSSSNDAWPGAGWAVLSTLEINRSTGTLGALIVNFLLIQNGSNITCVGLVNAASVPIEITTKAHVSFSYTRSSATITTAFGGSFLAQDFISFLNTAVATDDTPLLAPVNEANGMFAVREGCSGLIMLISATNLEGRNSRGAGQPGTTRVALSVWNNAHLVATGGSDANFFGDGGYLSARDGAAVYLTGNRVLPSKVATDITPDIRIRGGSTVISMGDWNKVADDTTLSGLAVVESSKWLHGDVAANTGAIIWGATGAGFGINTGANSVINVNDASVVEIGEPRINKNDAGAFAIQSQHRSHVHIGGSAAAFVELQGIAAGAVQLGGAAAIAGFLPGAAGTGLSDDIAAVLGTRQMASYESE